MFCGGTSTGMSEIVSIFVKYFRHFIYYLQEVWCGSQSPRTSFVTLITFITVTLMLIVLVFYSVAALPTLGKFDPLWSWNRGREHRRISKWSITGCTCWSTLARRTSSKTTPGWRTCWGQYKFLMSNLRSNIRQLPERIGHMQSKLVCTELSLCVCIRQYGWESHHQRVCCFIKWFHIGQVESGIGTENSNTCISRWL